MANAQIYLDQFHLIVPRKNARVFLQDEWYGTFGLRDVIELSSRFTAQQMLAREEFRKRLDKKTPIPIKDLLYPLLQAYDSVAIKADVEFGGTDQLFNILAGRELQEQIGQRPQAVFIVEMLEGLDGAKEVPIVELIVQAGLEKSKRAARTLVEQGAVRVDRERATLETRVPTSGELLMQLGPRRFARIRFR